jgi:hypothetical protein
MKPKIRTEEKIKDLVQITLGKLSFVHIDSLRRRSRISHANSEGQFALIRAIFATTSKKIIYIFYN